MKVPFLANLPIKYSKISSIKIAQVKASVVTITVKN